MVDFQIIYITVIIVILISIQYTLNKILMLLKEIKDKGITYNKFDKEIKRKTPEGDYFDEKERGNSIYERRY